VGVAGIALLRALLSPNFFNRPFSDDPIEGGISFAFYYSEENPLTARQRVAGTQPIGVLVEPRSFDVLLRLCELRQLVDRLRSLESNDFGVSKNIRS
jgi:hypothetical protein